ncbi:uncharacterized protein LOC111046094 [Nilaparvata lugens]|uniref:uncharacterized protein LOC111046094 n=1 Tax=Nilaparvata lugens TaxID=108931 RepID=UPI00193E0592|nr:uncharacterized protein LOC111046094 [Nilaparvata lugens]
MPRSKRNLRGSAKVNKMELEDKESSHATDSDFDEDEDPDTIEVPGGGKNLATAVSLGTRNSSEAKDSLKELEQFTKQQQQTPSAKPMQSGMLLPAAVSQPNKAGSKIPGGLVTKGNMTPGFEMVRGGSLGGGTAGYPGLQSAAATMLGALNYPSPLGFTGMLPPNINPAQYLQQTLDMGNFSNMGLNPFLLQSLQGMGNNGSALLNQLLNQGGMHPWAGSMGPKPPHFWMSDEAKSDDLDYDLE